MRLGRIGACIAILLLSVPASAEEPQLVRAAVLRVSIDAPLPISRLDLAPEDLGFAGARLGTEDNQTTRTRSSMGCTGARSTIRMPRSSKASRNCASSIATRAVSSARTPP